MLVPEIADFAAAPKPSLAAPTLLLKAVEAGQESIVEEGVSLAQVDDVEFDVSVLGGVDQPEVEPLRVALSVEVILKQQVVLEGGHLVGCEQVARLELSVEGKGGLGQFLLEERALAIVVRKFVSLYGEGVHEH